VTAKRGCEIAVKLAPAGTTGVLRADEATSERDPAVGTGVEDERDAVVVDGAAEPERLLDELEGNLGGGDNGHEVVGRSRAGCVATRAARDTSIAASSNASAPSSVAIPSLVTGGVKEAARAGP
jgi:hypothetical protein